MTRSRLAIVLTAAALALLGGAVALVRARSGSGGGLADRPAFPTSPPASASSSAPPANAPPAPADPDGPAKNGWSTPSRTEVNAAGLARAASRREKKERDPACPPRPGEEEGGGCEPGRAAESVEIDWNGRRASP